GDTVLLDFSLVFEAKLLLDFNFYREVVRVPARLAVDLESAHRAIAADWVFGRSRENMVNAGLSFWCVWGVVERIVGRILAGFYAFLEDPIVFPVGENLLFEIRQAHFVGYRLEHPANVARALWLRASVVSTQRHGAAEIICACGRYRRMRMRRQLKPQGQWEWTILRFHATRARSAR